MTSKAALSKKTAYGLIFLAIGQGYALYFLSLLLEHTLWPSQQPTWLNAIYAVVIALPAFFYLTLQRFSDKHNLLALLLLLLIFFGTGWHLGFLTQATPQEYGRFIFIYSFSMGLALFLFSLVFRAYVDGQWQNYAYWRTLACQFIQVICAVATFLGAFWALLALWAGLFSLIGVPFFDRLFFSDAFVYPVNWLVLGISLVFVRQKSLSTHALSICSYFAKALLPLAALISLLFLALLPFVGLQAIWDTGFASSLMLLLSLILLGLYNLILPNLQQTKSSYSGLLYFSHSALVLLPILVFLAAFALWQRIDQHGLTVSRLWAGTMLALTFFYSFSVSVQLLRHRLACKTQFAVLNKRFSVALLFLLLLINTPFGDFYRLSANNQVQRLIQGKTSPAQFDYRYLRFNLGPYGIQALEQLQSSKFATERPEIAAKIQLVLDKKSPWDKAKSESKTLTLLINNHTKTQNLPETVIKKIANDLPACLSTSNQCHAYYLHQDAEDWLILNELYHNGGVYRKIDQQWQWLGRLQKNCADYKKRLPPKTVSQINNRYFLLYQADDCFYSLEPNRQFILQHFGKHAAKQ